MTVDSLPEISELERVVTAELPSWPVMDESIIENVVKVFRCSTVVKGGRRCSFAACAMSCV